MKIRVIGKEKYVLASDVSGNIHDEDGRLIMNEDMSEYCGQLLEVEEVVRGVNGVNLYYKCKNMLFLWSSEVCEIVYDYREYPLYHPKCGENLFWSLIDKWNKYGTLYIGVDFDNTIKPYKESFEESEAGYGQIVTLLKDCKRVGMKLCLWSLCDSGENLAWKEDWCLNMGIGMDYINESPLLKEMTEQSKGHKPYFNLLLDDTAGLAEAYSVLRNVVNYIERK